MIRKTIQDLFIDRQRLLQATGLMVLGSKPQVRVYIHFTTSVYLSILKGV